MNGASSLIVSLAPGSDLIGRGSSGFVRRGQVVEDGRSVAIKTYSLCEDSLAAAEAEASIYQELESLQGWVIPTLLGTGRLPLIGTGFIAISLVDGERLSNVACHDSQRRCEATALAARHALFLIHEKGVAHGDIRLANIILLNEDNTMKHSPLSSRSSISSSSLKNFGLEGVLDRPSSSDSLDPTCNIHSLQDSPGESEACGLKRCRASCVMIVDFGRSFHADRKTLHSEMRQLDSVLQAWIGGRDD